MHIISKMLSLNCIKQLFIDKKSKFLIVNVIHDIDNILHTLIGEN